MSGDEWSFFGGGGVGGGGSGGGGSGGCGRVVEAEE